VEEVGLEMMDGAKAAVDPSAERRRAVQSFMVY
jgi:hypothetical protein